MVKRYKLLRDLPTFHAGDSFTLADDGCLYLTEPCDFNNHWKNRVMAYHKNTLERFPNILEDWFEEIEGPKEYYYIDYSIGYINREPDFDCLVDERRKQLGNYYESEEEAKLAVEKLEAWKRLKDKGFRFDGYDATHTFNGDLCGPLFYNAGGCCIEDVKKDMDLLFGGEE